MLPPLLNPTHLPVRSSHQENIESLFYFPTASELLKQCFSIFDFDCGVEGIHFFQIVFIFNKCVFFPMGIKKDEFAIIKLQVVFLPRDYG